MTSFSFKLTQKINSFFHSKVRGKPHLLNRCEPTHAYWFRAMVDESIDFTMKTVQRYARALSGLSQLRNRTESQSIPLVTFSRYCKIDHIYSWSVLSLTETVEMMPYDVQNLAVKSLAWGSWFHSSFEHFMASFL